MGLTSCSCGGGLEVLASIVLVSGSCCGGLKVLASIVLVSGSGDGQLSIGCEWALVFGGRWGGAVFSGGFPSLTVAVRGLYFESLSVITAVNDKNFL